LPHYEILVQYASGQSASSIRVSIGSTWGVTGPEYTDRNGRAVLESSATSVTVYVNGRNEGTARPGRFVVTL
jgi:hypothetical protein